MKKVRVLAVLAVILLALSTVFLLDSPLFFRVWKGETIELNAAETVDLQKGGAVTGTFDTVLGCCAEEYETTFGIRSSKESSKLYYVVRLPNGRFAVYCTSNKKEYAKLDEIMEELYQSLSEYEQSKDYEDLLQPSKNIKIQGVVSKMPTDIERYFRSFYEKHLGDEFETDCEPLMISYMNFGNFPYIFGGGILLALSGLGCGICALIVRRRAKQKNQ